MPSSRVSFRDQIGMAEQRRSHESSVIPKSTLDKLQLAVEIDDATDTISTHFQTKFNPADMRQLALVAHNHMKPAMKDFIVTYSEILQKFRITGTETTTRMCKALWGEDNPEIEYGLTCTSGPLGGDAQIAALMCMEDLGALIFFIDPLSAHPHQADIDSLARLANCGNIIVCSNPTSAMSMMHVFQSALETGNRGMIPSFFETLESPAVEEYKHQQELALQSAIACAGPRKERPMLGLDASAYVLLEEIDVDISDYDEEETLYDVEAMHSGLRNFDTSSIGRRRPSTLSGIKIKDKNKKKRGLIMQLQSRMRRLRSKEMK